MWIKDINMFYEKKIEGINKIIKIIHNEYDNERHVENLLKLLDICTDDDMQKLFGKKILLKNRELISKIEELMSEYAIEIELGGKTLGEILDDIYDLKNKYSNNIYDDNQVELYNYNTVKKEHILIGLKKFFDAT
jgi:glutamine synthetase type III